MTIAKKEKQSEVVIIATLLSICRDGAINLQEQRTSKCPRSTELVWFMMQIKTMLLTKNKRLRSKSYAECQRRSFWKRLTKKMQNSGWSSRTQRKMNSLKYAYNMLTSNSEVKKVIIH